MNQNIKDLALSTGALAAALAALQQGASEGATIRVAPSGSPFAAAVAKGLDNVRLEAALVRAAPAWLPSVVATDDEMSATALRLAQAQPWTADATTEDGQFGASACYTNCHSACHSSRGWR